MPLPGITPFQCCAPHIYQEADGTIVMQVGTRTNYTAVGANYTVLGTDGVLGVNSATGAWTLTLEAAANAGAGRVVYICDAGSNATANNITINPAGTEQIDLGGAGVGITIAADDGQTAVVCDGTGWFTIV